MTKEEQKALLDEVTVQATKATESKVAEITKAAEDAAKLAAEEAVKNGGQVSKETYDNYVTAQKEAFEKLEKIAIEQGTVIKEMKMQGLGNIVKSAFDVLKEGVEKNKEAISKVFKGESPVFTLKNVINIGGISAPNSYSGSAIAASVTGSSSLRENGQGAEVFVQSRNRPVITDFVDSRTSDLPVFTYFEENNRTGSFQVTVEGGLKPFLGFSMTKKVADYKKVAGRAPFTEELMMDFPYLYSTIVSLIKYDCTNDLDSLLMTDAVTAAAPYLNPSLALQIDNADMYAAIGAGVCQLQLANKNPNVLVLNPADLWKMKLLKGSDGHYIMPPFMFNEQSISFGRVIESNKVAAGNFFLADASAYKVIFRKGMDVRVVYAADTNDAVRNQVTLLVEQYYFNFIPTNLRPAFLYANFAAVITAIEKP